MAVRQVNSYEDGSKMIADIEHAELMEGETRSMSVFDQQHSLRHVGWLGQTGAFYPVTVEGEVIRRYERGSYAPIYMEVE